MKHKTCAIVTVLAAILVTACGKHNSSSATNTAHPDLPPGQQIQTGVLRSEVTLNRAGVPMKLWVYLPAQHADKLPCVLIAPAGTPLFHGMALGPGDEAEHIPYVQKGLAVVAYEIDGALENPRPTDRQLTAAIAAFRAADAGIANARAALDYLADKVPAVDMSKVFAVGHSSAATLALQVAANDDRIAGVVAYAPCCDVLSRILAQPGDIGTLEKLSPGTKDFLAEHSPDHLTEKIKCPVMLFSAIDDTNVRTTEVSAFAAELKQTHSNITMVTATRGGHYDSMINQGIPKGIDWLKKTAGIQEQP